MDAPDLSDVLVVMDFDGTITTSDCLRTVLARNGVAPPAVTAAARAEGLSETAALVQAVGRLRVPKARLLAEFAGAATLREGFHGFLGAVLGRGARVFLISVGFAEGIEAVWRREGLPPVPMLASRLDGDETLGYHLHVDERFGDCPVCGAGMCKGPAVDALRRRGDRVVAFGDGARDLCMARRADLVFARDELAALCDREGVGYVPLTGFTRALRELDRRLGEGPGGRRP